MPWPEELRIEVVAPPQGVKGGESVDVEVFFANVGPAPLRLPFKTRSETEGKDAGRARLHVYPRGANGRRLDVPSMVLGMLAGGSGATALVTLAPGGWARALGELQAKGFAPSRKAQLGEELLPLPPGRYRLGVDTNLPFASPPRVEAFIDVL